MIFMNTATINFVISVGNNLWFCTRKLTPEGLSDVSSLTSNPSDMESIIEAFLDVSNFFYSMNSTNINSHELLMYQAGKSYYT